MSNNQLLLQPVAPPAPPCPLPAAAVDMKPTGNKDLCAFNALTLIPHLSDLCVTPTNTHMMQSPEPETGTSHPSKSTTALKA